jgi:superkiller protein 3
MRTRWIPLALGTLCVMLGGFQNACAQSASAARKRVADPAAQALNDLLNAAQTEIDKQDFEGAAQDYRDYLTKRPDDAMVHYDLGYIYSALNRPGDAKDQYQRAIALDPKMAAAYLNLGATLLGSDPAAAVEPLEKAADLAPQDAHTKWVLGTAFEKSGKLSDAIGQYQAAKHLDDADFKTRLSLARTLLEAGHPTDAEVEYRAALLLPGAPAEMAQAHRGLAEALIIGKKVPEASSELAAYLGSQPDDAKARVDYASLLFDQGKYDDALANLDRAAKSGPEDLRAIKLRSDIFWQQKRYPDAVAVLQKAAAVAPNDADISARLGEAYLHTKDYPNATRWLAASYHLNPNANDVLAYLIDAEFGGKNYALALSALDELSRREQLPMASWYVRAVCYDNLGQAAQALDAYQKFLQLNKDENGDMYFVSAARVRVLTRELQNKKR